MPLFGSIPANQNVEVDPVWVQPGAPTAPDSGELWWDTDDTSAGITTPLGVTDGGTGATSPATARASLAVPSIGNSTTVAGAPTTGTWARGDQYLDSANVVWTCVTGGTPGMWMPPIGYEYAYNTAAAQLAITSTNQAAPHLIIEGTSRTYDGSPVIVEVNMTVLQAPGAAGQAIMVNLWDTATNLGVIGEIWNTAAAAGISIHGRTRLTPTAGTHNYRVMAWVNGGSGTLYLPAFIRVTKA